MLLANKWEEYKLIDMANGQKLEKWGNITLSRPDPQIIWKNKCFPEKWKNETKWLFYFSKKFAPNYTPIEVATLLVWSLRKHPPIAYKNQGGGDDVFTAKVSAIAAEKLLMHFKDYLEISYVDRDTLESLLIVVKKWGVYELIKINVF